MISGCDSAPFALPRAGADPCWHSCARWSFSTGSMTQQHRTGRGMTGAPSIGPPYSITVTSRRRWLRRYAT